MPGTAPASHRDRKHRQTRASSPLAPDLHHESRRYERLQTYSNTLSYNGCFDGLAIGRYRDLFPAMRPVIPCRFRERNRHLRVRNSRRTSRDGAARREPGHAPLVRKGRSEQGKEWEGESYLNHCCRDLPFWTVVGRESGWGRTNEWLLQRLLIRMKWLWGGG